MSQDTKDPNERFTKEFRKLLNDSRVGGASLQHVVCEIELVKTEILNNVIILRNMASVPQQAESILKGK